jgi:hypothetical protein
MDLRRPQRPVCGQKASAEENSDRHLEGELCVYVPIGVVRQLYS